MSIEVKCFDDRGAEDALKKCPKIVRDYVKLLKENKERWRKLTGEAISKLKAQAKVKNNVCLDGVSKSDFKCTGYCESCEHYHFILKGSICPHNSSC